MRNKAFILNYLFLGGIVLLFINDHFLKEMFHNTFTGKFSDFLGMMIFPLFLAFLFPKLRFYAVGISIVFFAFWKSPYSQPLIDFYNLFAPIEITRVVDYTDLIAFLVLPIPFALIKHPELLRGIKIEKIPTEVVLFPSILVMMATSPPRPSSYTFDGELFFANFSYEIKKSKDEILSDLDKMGIKWHKDTLLIIKQYDGYRKNIEFKDKNLDSIRLNREKLREDINRAIRESDEYIVKEFKVENETLSDIRFRIIERRNIFNKPISDIYIYSAKTDRKIILGEIEENWEKIYQGLIKKAFQESLKGNIK